MDVGVGKTQKIGRLCSPYTRQFITYDAEFMDDGDTIDLVSISMRSGDDRSIYAVSRQFSQAKLLGNKWMRENVWPHLPVVKPVMGEPTKNWRTGEMESKPATPCRCAPADDGGYACLHWNGALDKDHPDVRPLGQIRRLVQDFIWSCHPSDVDLDRDNVQMWAWYSAYDHVSLAQLFGPMIDLPRHVPMYTNDLKTVGMMLPNVEVPKQPDGEHDASADTRHNLTRARCYWDAARELMGF